MKMRLSSAVIELVGSGIMEQREREYCRGSGQKRSRDRGAGLRPDVLGFRLERALGRFYRSASMECVHWQVGRDEKGGADGTSQKAWLWGSSL